MFRSYYLFSVISFTTTFSEKCNGSVTFFVMDNTKLISTNGSVVYGDTAEEDCMRICERNRVSQRIYIKDFKIISGLAKSISYL